MAIWRHEVTEISGLVLASYSPIVPSLAVGWQGAVSRGWPYGSRDIVMNQVSYSRIKDHLSSTISSK